MDRREHGVLRRRRGPAAAALALCWAMVVAPAGGAPSGDAAAPVAPDAAFVVGVERAADASIVVHWAIADGHYLLRDGMGFEIVRGEGRLGEPRFSAATTRQLPGGGTTAVFRREASVRLPLASAPGPGSRLRLTYRGCPAAADRCRAPVERTVALAGLAAAGPEPARGDAHGTFPGGWPVWLTAVALLAAAAPVLAGRLGHRSGRRRALAGRSLLLGGAGVALAATAALPSPTWTGPARPADVRSAAGPDEVHRRLHRARSSGRGVVVTVHADWCRACVALEDRTLAAPRVRRALADAERLRVDVTAARGNDPILERLDVLGPPAVLFFGADGIERRGYRVTAFEPPAAFARRARLALAPTGGGS